MIAQGCIGSKAKADAGPRHRLSEGMAIYDAYWARCVGCASLLCFVITEVRQNGCDGCSNSQERLAIARVILFRVLR